VFFVIIIVLSLCVYMYGVHISFPHMRDIGILGLVRLLARGFMIGIPCGTTSAEEAEKKIRHVFLGIGGLGCGSYADLVGVHPKA
jgi:hypothetical protein